MKLGIIAGYSPATMSVPMDLIHEAENLGFDSVWTAEAYGSDALTPLGYLAACTERIRLATTSLLLPIHEPLRLADEIAALDRASRGDRAACHTRSGKRGFRRLSIR